MKIFSHKDSIRSRIAIATVFVSILIIGGGSALTDYHQSSDTEKPASLETYVKVIGGIVAGLGTLFGLPITILQFQKTRAEIRKLELETESLKAKNISTGGTWQSNKIIIDHSDNASVQILADPRFLGPLLLLLDFIIAWIILSLASYALDTFLDGTLRALVLGLLAIILLVPIAREARRVKKVLRPPET
jgi:hypothetical protein